MLLVQSKSKTALFTRLNVDSAIVARVFTIWTFDYVWAYFDCVSFSLSPFNRFRYSIMRKKWSNSCLLSNIIFWSTFYLLHFFCFSLFFVRVLLCIYLFLPENQRDLLCYCHNFSQSSFDQYRPIFFILNVRCYQFT